MHYIRFLKPPQVISKSGSVLVSALITVTTDLGETFYPHALDLVATIRSSDPHGDIYLRRRVQWQADARNAAITFDIGNQDVEWPACMHVGVRNSSTSSKTAGFLPAIVDIWSGSMDATAGQLHSGWRVERRFSSLAERTVSLLEDAGDSIARHLWDGSQVLMQFIDQVINLRLEGSPLPLLEYVLVSATYRRLNVLELGCGCGSVGISLAQSIPDCDVVLTDLPEVTELVQANIARMSPAISSHVAFEPLDWLQPLTGKLQSRAHDLIIVSECTYNTDTLAPLVDTLVTLLARSPKAVVVLATKTRHASEAVVFELLEKAGIILEGSTRLALPGEPGTGYGDAASDVGVHVLHGREHRLSLTPRGSDEVVPKVGRRNRTRSNEVSRSQGL